MLGQSTAGASREFHNLAELTKKRIIKRSSFSKRRNQLFTMTHTQIRVYKQIKKTRRAVQMTINKLISKK